MTHIGEPVEPIKIKRQVPARREEEYPIISVPVRPSEKARRRRKVWEGPLPEPQHEPARREKEPA